MIANIMIVLGGIAVAVGLVLLIVAIVKNDVYDKHIVLYGITVLAAVILVSGLYMRLKEDTEKEWISAVEEGYDFYVDGQSANPENLSVSNYSNIEFDDANHKVLISTTSR